MKITGFRPAIASSMSTELISLFNALGFEKTHAPIVTSGTSSATVTTMKHPNGYHVDVLSPDTPLPRDLMAIRINVDNFDEAYALLKAHGCEIAPGDEIVDAGFAKLTMMVAPSGFLISLIEHRK